MLAPAKDGVTQNTQKWRKILYEDQGLPSNYTDETFLEDMKKNVNTRMHDLRNVIFESGIVSQQLASITIFVCVYVKLEDLSLDPNILLFIMFCLVAIESATRYLMLKLEPDISSFMIVSAFIFGLSPILKTLMKTISTDTIYAMTTLMFICNLLFQDYGVDSAVVSKAISLNAGIFGAVCLASRLDSSWHVYVCVMFSIYLFALLPEYRKKVKTWHRKAYILQTEVTVLIAIFMLSGLSQAGAMAMFLSHVAITIFFPLWMIRLQSLKNNIHGPWDEAVPNIKH